MGVFLWQDLAQDLWCIKGTDKSTLGKNSSVSFICFDLKDLWLLLLIQNTPY